MFSIEKAPLFCLPESLTPRDYMGRQLFEHAEELPFSWSEDFWERKNKEMASIARQNCQIVVIRPNSNDVTGPLHQSLTENPLGKFPVAITTEQPFPDGETDTSIDNEAVGAQSVYLVASILNAKDLFQVAGVADHYKITLNAKFVTLVCPFLAFTRKDKNVTPDGAYEPNVTSARTGIVMLSRSIDRMIVVEPHSSATQYFAAQFGIPLAPISPLELMANTLRQRMEQKEIRLNQENAVVIRPDSGRNLAAKRIGEHLRLPHVSFDKHRTSDGTVDFGELSEEDQELVRGRIGICYDDEASTMGTLYTLADKLQSYGLRALAVCIAHCKFTPGWEKRIEHPLFSIVIGTDSRQPIGNIRTASNIEIISLEPFLRQVIAADIKGINFWKDSRFKNMLIQE